MSSPAEIPDDMWAHPTLKKDVYKKKVKFCKKDCREKLCKSTVAKLFITNVSIDTFVAFINIIYLLCLCDSCFLDEQVRRREQSQVS
jgi:hypothetical protein